MAASLLYSGPHTGTQRVCRASRLLLAITLCGLTPGIASSDSDDRRDRDPRLIVKFRGEGPHALNDCAQAVTREGRRFEAATADSSPSIDDLHRRHRVAQVRALFRPPDRRSFGIQRDELRARLAARTSSRRAAAELRPGTVSSPSPTPDLAHVYAFTLASDGDAARAVADYRDDPHVEWAQLDHENALDDVDDEPVWLPDDPFLFSSGSWGQPYEDLWGVRRIEAPAAWEISRGEGVVVGVVDTGLDYEHPDIAENVWINPGEDLDGNGRVDPSDRNGIDDDGNGFVDDLRGFDFENSFDANEDGDYLDPEDVNDPDPFDDHGHGTHVSGTIAAVGNNSLGIIGVAPRALVMAVKGFDETGTGLDSILWRGVLYAAENGASVINTSWSCSGTCPYNPLGEEVSALVRDMGVVIVTSAGNNQVDVAYKSPENRRQVITVGSSGQDDLRSRSFSNFGYLLDLAAPGGDPGLVGVIEGRSNILSLRASASTAAEVFSVGPLYDRKVGTSMSAPHVAGVVALLRSAEPELGFEEIRSILRRESTDLGPPGHDREMGAGRLDALASLTHAPVQDVLVEMTHPRPADVLRPQDGDVEILGRAMGADLVEYRLSYGFGTDPASWTDFTGPLDSVVLDGVLGTFPASSLGEGPYTLRSEAVARDGSMSVEYLPISLERITPMQLSSSGPAASRPHLLDGRVIWNSRRDSTRPAVEVGDQNLFATEIETRREWVVQAGPGDQTTGALGTGIAAWLDDRLEPGRADLVACRLRGFGKPCDLEAVAEGPFFALQPVVVGHHIYWTSGNVIEGCSLAPGRHASKNTAKQDGCEPISLDLDTRRRTLLSTDGQSLAWWNLPPSIGLSVCRVLPWSGLCKSEHVIPERIGGTFPTASGPFAAWSTFGGTEGQPLWVCKRDPEDGRCPTLRVAMPIFDDPPRLSGNRLAFTSRLPDQESDIFLCEYDPVLRECPIQRVTAAATAQRAPSIDGDWIVWEDGRVGQTQIFGLALPRLRVPRDRSVHAGTRLVVPVSAARFEDRGLSLEIEVVGGGSLEELGARFVDRGNGKGRLVWTPRLDQVGEHDFRLTARTKDGLYTKAHLRVDVRLRPKVGSRVWDSRIRSKFSH